MSITVNWAAVAGVTGYVLYRNAGSPVNMSSLPTDKVDVGSGITTYTYPTGVNNTVYYVVVGAKKADGTITYSDQIPTGYFPDSGPGPVNLLRGDWSFGYFGEVPATELFVGSELYNALIANAGANAIPPTSNPVITVYQKCIVNGRILFFPDQVYSASTVTPALMIGSKLIVTDGDYVNKGVLVNKNGYEYVARLPHATTGALNAIVSSYENVYQTELGMAFSLFGTTVGAVPPTPGVTSYAKYRLGDLSSSPWVSTMPTTTPGSAITYIYAVIANNTINTSNTGQARPYIVLELLF